MAQKMMNSFENIDTSVQLTDEELLAMFRPKKTNQDKSLIPLYIFLILQRMSSEQAPLMQAEIRKILLDEYEIEIGRQALGRQLHTIEDGKDLGIYSCAKGWYYAK